MRPPEAGQRHPAPTMWRTFGLLLGFAVLVAIGIVTVLLPELDEDRADEHSVEMERDRQSNDETTMQE